MILPFLWVYIKLHLHTCQHPSQHLPLTPTTPTTFFKWLMHGNSLYVMLLKGNVYSIIGLMALKGR
jgi:hypothetical protein